MTTRVNADLVGQGKLDGPHAAEACRVVEQELQRTVPSVQDIQVEEVHFVRQFHLETERTSRYAVFLTSSDTPIRVVGRDNLYSSYLLQRIERELLLRITSALDVDDMRIQVLGRTLGSLGNRDHFQRSPRPKSLDTLYTDRALALGIIQKNGAVHRCCRAYNINRVILRSGRVIGPSPALVEVLEGLVQSGNCGIKLVYDPFSGAGTTERVFARLDQSIRVISADWIDRLGQHTGTDSFQDVPQDAFDLAVLDPLYEDLPEYIDSVLPRLKVRYLAVQSGDAVDLHWRRVVDYRLDREWEQLADRVLFGKQVQLRRRRCGSK